MSILLRANEYLPLTSGEEMSLSSQLEAIMAASSYLELESDDESPSDATG